VFGDFLKGGGDANEHLSQVFAHLRGVFFLMSALQLVRYFNERADIWWTPKPLSLALADASDRVEVYVRDVALLEHVKAGRVQVLTDTVARPLMESDIRLRLNNWDHVRAERIPSLLGIGIALGASAVFFLFGVLGWGPPKPTRLPSRA
jgi:hypothetical protein